MEGGSPAKYALGIPCQSAALYGFCRIAHCLLFRCARPDSAQIIQDPITFTSALHLSLRAATRCQSVMSLHHRRGQVCMIPRTQEFFIALVDHDEWGAAHTVWGEVSHL